ncbi:MAG TPA: J domain-containing protein [Anaerolineales bacterium]|nr:J domain-containing protein [Anaerolineales bacterium]
MLPGVYDPQLLSLLGSSPQADIAEIKKRFRDLAKRYHPDLGGDGEKFIELMETYERLTAGDKGNHASSAR